MSQTHEMSGVLSPVINSFKSDAELIGDLDALGFEMSSLGD